MQEMVEPRQLIKMEILNRDELLALRSEYERLFPPTGREKPQTFEEHVNPVVNESILDQKKQQHQG